MPDTSQMVPTTTRYQDAEGRVDVSALKADMDEAGVDYADLAVEIYAPEAPTPGRYEHVRRVINGVAPSNGTAQKAVAAFEAIKEREGLA